MRRCYHLRLRGGSPALFPVQWIASCCSWPSCNTSASRGSYTVLIRARTARICFGLKHNVFSVRTQLRLRSPDPWGFTCADRNAHVSCSVQICRTKNTNLRTTLTPFASQRQSKSLVCGGVFLDLLFEMGLQVRAKSADGGSHGLKSGNSHETAFAEMNAALDSGCLVKGSSAPGRVEISLTLKKCLRFLILAAALLAFKFWSAAAEQSWHL